MDNGWQQLGAALGGNQSENAYHEGLATGAKTQLALAEARRRVDENVARESLAESLGDVFGGTPGPNQTSDQALAYANMARSGVNLGDVFGARLKDQEYGFRDRAVNAPTFAEGNRALMGVENSPVERFASAGEGMMQDKFSNEAPVLTPLGDALVGQRTAAAALSDERRLNPESFRSTGAPGGGKVVDIGGVKYVFHGMDDEGNPSVTPLLSPEATADNLNTTAGARAGATAEGKARGAAVVALPGKLLDISRMRGNVKNLLTQPGFDTIYGLSSQLNPSMYIRGSDAMIAEAARKQIDAQSFGVSIQIMRGLGQLSNAEGLKVQQALTQATNPELGEAEAKIAWQQFLDQLDVFEAVARQEAGGDFSGDAVPPEMPAAPGTAISLDEYLKSKGF